MSCLLIFLGFYTCRVYINSLVGLRLRVSNVILSVLYEESQQRLNLDTQHRQKLLFETSVEVPTQQAHNIIIRYQR